MLLPSGVKDPKKEKKIKKEIIVFIRTGEHAQCARMCRTHAEIYVLFRFSA